MTVSVWVDADACPNVVREIICKASMRTGVEAIFVANQPIRLYSHPALRSVQVEKGFDVADHYIAQQSSKGDLVVTSDIPLAAEVIAKGAQAVNHRGEVFSPETIRGRLNIRDFMDTMRATGVQTGGPPPLGAREKQAFANALDRYLAIAKRST